MRIDSHPEDFLELDGSTLAGIRMQARELPTGKRCRELTPDDLQRFVDGRIVESWGPAALAVRQRVLTLLEAGKARHRAELRAKWAKEDEDAAHADLIEALNGILDFAETGDVERVPVVRATEVAEKAIAEAAPANYTRTEADQVIALAKEHGFIRVVDHSYVGDGTTRLILIKPPQSPFSRADIQQCIDTTQRQALTCSPGQRLCQVEEALDVFDRYGGAQLLPEGPVRVRLLERIAKFRQKGADHSPDIGQSAVALIETMAANASQPSGP